MSEETLRLARHFCIALSLFWACSAAAKTPQSKSKKPRSAFERDLRANGWALTNKVEIIKAGDIVNERTHTRWARGSDCFAASPVRRNIASSKVVKKSSIKAGGLWGAVSAKAKAGKYVARLYKAPYIEAIPASQLQLQSACLERLRHDPNKGDLVVVTDVVAARYKTVEARSYEALVKMVRVANAGAKHRKKSVSASKEHIAIAYKRRPVVGFFPLDPRRQGTLKITTRALDGSRCAGRVRVDGEDVGYTGPRLPLTVPVSAGTPHTAKGFCQSGRSDLVRVNVKPGMTRNVSLKMQRFTPEQLREAEETYLASKRWDTAGYVVSGGLLATAAGFYVRSTLLYAQSDDAPADSRRADQLVSSGDTSRLVAIYTGGGGAVVLGSTLTHALLSTAFKKAAYQRRKKSRGD